ncbi:MAG: 4Fe-4S binding protein [Spirochaetales bacterium]|nr:4Fe-4S binding protein [Spirochaetales bacterium]
MVSLKYIIINTIGTLLRGFPMPVKTGLTKIGNPDKTSPVFLTCNYAVTVERVKKALKGTDCYLLIANSHGINVWCASTGGHLTNHSVISALKTSGIENLVDHRKIILPQLAAAGIEPGVIREKTGWHTVWGPVYAGDIPRFVRRGYSKNANMRMVKFHFSQRLEMAVMWAFPFSVILTLLTFLLWKQMLVFTVTASWTVPLFVFSTFPMYSRFLSGKPGKLSISRYTVLFNIGWISVILWAVFMLGIILYTAAAGTFSVSILPRWGFVSLAIMLLVNIDLMGSTPIYKSGLQEERLLKVVLETEKCTGCSACVNVCPRNCFIIEEKLKKAVITGTERCVQCSACIVQCPTDALYFTSRSGNFIMPETIRKYKLNMMGSRLAKKT